MPGWLIKIVSRSVVPERGNPTRNTGEGRLSITAARHELTHAGVSVLALVTEHLPEGDRPLFRLRRIRADNRIHPLESDECFIVLAGSFE